MIRRRGFQSLPSSLNGAMLFEPDSSTRDFISASNGSKSTLSICPRSRSGGSFCFPGLVILAGIEISTPAELNDSASHSVAIGIVPSREHSALTIRPIRPDGLTEEPSFSQSNQSARENPVSNRSRVLDTASVRSNQGARLENSSRAIDCKSDSERPLETMFWGNWLFWISSIVRSIPCSIPRMRSRIRW